MVRSIRKSRDGFHLNLKDWQDEKNRSRSLPEQLFDICIAISIAISISISIAISMILVDASLFKGVLCWDRLQEISSERHSLI
jgi:hypothetical protein